MDPTLLTPAAPHQALSPVGELAFSAIIPTKYRPESVELTVRTVLYQTRVPCQIIVVDQSSSSDTRRRIESQYALAPAHVRHATTLTYIYDPDIAGAAAARNRGMDAAVGNIWLFMDDDVELEPDCLEHLANAYKCYPHVTGVAGVFTNYRPPKWWVRAWRRMFLCGVFHDERMPVYWNASRLRRAQPIRVRKFTGALMSFRADAVRRIRFDEHVRGTSAEDADFCAHLPANSALVITPRARVLHRLAPEGRSGHHWVECGVERAYYLYRRHWNFGVRHRLALGWLLAGYAIAATLASIRRWSFEPWRGLRSAIQRAAFEAGQSAK